MEVESPKNLALQFHLGIYAIIEIKEKILLVKKTRGPYQGMWDLPGGRPSHGESILQTLQREVLEETGVQLIDAVLHTNQAFTVEYKEGNKTISLHHTCLIYKARNFDISHFQGTIQEEDVSGAAWIPKTELKTIPLSKVVLCAI